MLSIKVSLFVIYCVVSVFLIGPWLTQGLFFFLKIIYLFIHVRHRQRGRGRSRPHAGSLMWDSNPRLQDHALGWRQMPNRWANQASQLKVLLAHEYTWSQRNNQTQIYVFHHLLMQVFAILLSRKRNITLMQAQWGLVRRSVYQFGWADPPHCWVSWVSAASHHASQSPSLLWYSLSGDCHWCQHCHVVLSVHHHVVFTWNKAALLVVTENQTPS